MKADRVPDGRVNVAVLFPADLHEQLKRKAAEADLSLSQLLRKLARDYLDTHPD